MQSFSKPVYQASVALVYSLLRVLYSSLFLKALQTHTHLELRFDRREAWLDCVDGFAKGHVRMGVGFARVRFAYEAMRIANPHHRTAAVLVYCAHAYEPPMAGQFAKYQEGLQIT